jgi:hypothetical protein
MTIPVTSRGNSYCRRLARVAPLGGGAISLTEERREELLSTMPWSARRRGRGVQKLDRGEVRGLLRPR